jgi:methionine-rich copper-binding protein CopC
MRGRWFAAAVLLALAFPARSAAHASFATSHPAPGSNVRVAPTQITMTFSEPLNRRVSAAELLDGLRRRCLAASFLACLLLMAAFYYST